MSKGKKRIGIYGGTFNPPHNGHVLAARKFVSALLLDELYIIPTFIPPHKVEGDRVSPLDRLKMCELAFKSVPKAKVSDIEIKRGGKSYTYLTLEELTAPDRELFFLCGTDMFLTLDEWRLPERIFELCTLVLSRRETSLKTDKQILEKYDVYRSEYGAKIILLDGEVIDISSSDIRGNFSLLSSGEYLSHDVFDYVIENNLYGLGYTEENLAYIRRRLPEFMGEKRFRHTLGVESTVAFIGEHILPGRVNELRAAALLHDIAKEIGKDRQLSLISQNKFFELDFSLESESLYHAFASPALIIKEFPQFSTTNILNSCFNHTTGRAGMTLFEEIVFLSDYIEPTRVYDRCIALREKLVTGILSAGSVDEKIKTLHECTLLALTYTKEFLTERNMKISPATENTINYISALL